MQRRAREPVAQSLLPHESIAALEILRIVKGDLAREVHAKRDELVARPSDVADTAAGGRPDVLHEVIVAIAPIEPVARP